MKIFNFIKISFLINQDPTGTNSNELKILIKNQDLIEIDTFTQYSNKKFLKIFVFF